MDTNFEFIGLTRLGIKPECTAPEADALTIRLSKLLNFHLNALKKPGTLVSFRLCTVIYSSNH